MYTDTTLNLIKHMQFRKYILSLSILVFLITVSSCGDRGSITKETSWPNGQLKVSYEVLMIENDKEMKHGIYRSWYESGNLHEEGRFEKDRKDGIWTTWHDAKDRIKLMEGQFAKGEMHGIWRWWMSPRHRHNHSRMNEHHHLDTKADSNAVHPQPHKIATYDMGVPHGLSMSWHHSGMVADSMTYRHGKLHGTSVSYHENGIKAAEVHYSDGILVKPKILQDSLGRSIGTSE